MRKLRSFDPVCDQNARVVILGSMPGAKSLSTAEYYAHPRNAFWKIMEDITGFEAGARYDERLCALKACGIALWDVLHSCHRQGSLDAAIRRGSVRVNAFDTFFEQHSKIATVLFNGATAEHYYRRHVLPGTKRENLQLLAALPSTSPAHAALSFEQKLAKWRAALLPRLS